MQKIDSKLNLLLGLFGYQFLVYFLKKNGEMGKNTSISLGSHFEEFISKEVKSGRYSSASEVVRSALRLLEVEEHKMQELRDALITGEKSGMVDDFDPKSHLESLHKKHL